MSVTYFTKHALPYRKLTLNRTQKICFIQISILCWFVMAVTRFTIPVPLFLFSVISSFFPFPLQFVLVIVRMNLEKRLHSIRESKILLPYTKQNNTEPDPVEALISQKQHKLCLEIIVWKKYHEGKSEMRCMIASKRMSYINPTYNNKIFLGWICALHTRLKFIDKPCNWMIICYALEWLLPIPCFPQYWSNYCMRK